MKTIKIFIIVAFLSLAFGSVQAIPTLPSLNRIKDVTATIENGVLKGVHFGTHPSLYTTKDAVLQIWEGVDSKMVSETPLYYDRTVNCTCFESLMDIKLDESKDYTIVIPEGAFIDMAFGDTPDTTNPAYTNLKIYHPLPGFEAPSIELVKSETIETDGMINTVKLFLPALSDLSVAEDAVISLECLSMNLTDISRYIYPKEITLEHDGEYDVATLTFEPLSPNQTYYLLVSSASFQDTNNSEMINWVYYFNVNGDSAIDQISVGRQDTDTLIYDLKGHRMTQPEKGQLYIKDGHKFIAR